LLASTNLDNEQAEYTNSINIASTNLLNIINDILDFSKIESGQIVMEHIKFSLKEQIQNVRKILTFNAQIKNLEFKYYFDEKLPDMVMGDPTRLNQVMVNLLNNAIKFTEEGFVELRVEVVKKLENKTEVKFEINDSGIGIAPGKLEVIFDRFTQANTNTTRKYGGTGLGLSISKSLAELLGGELIVDSEEGKGSTFSFNLLFENPVEAEESEIKLVEPETGLYDTKILLVEDNLLNQKLALRVLQKRGFLADLAENGAEAVEILKTKTYDLILMDLQMPEMDGYQATTYIRNEMKLQTPIIAMTAHSIVGEKAKCLDIGMNDYLPKPFDPNLLHSKILEYTKKDNNDN
jgi:CheY-like chemotaxis protein